MTSAPERIWAVHHETQGSVMIGEWGDTIRHIGGIEYIRADLCRPEAQGWQPIETAPRDGTSIIIACDYDRLGKSRVTMVWHEESMWVEAKHWDEDAEDWIFLECDFRATHWMPLPEPPKP